MTDIKIPGLDHPITIEPTRGQVTVRLGGRVIADTTRALTLREASYPPVQYVPLADVDPAVLRAERPRPTWCPYKGTRPTTTCGSATRSSRDALWSYPAPHDAVAEIKDHVAFYPDRVDAIEVHDALSTTSPADRSIRTPRLQLRPWSVDDAEAALAVYGADDVARWLSPAMDRVPDADAMRALIEQLARRRSWQLPAGPVGRRAHATPGEVVGGVAVLPLPPDGEDLEIAWQLAPDAWGQGLRHRGRPRGGARTPSTPAPRSSSRSSAPQNGRGAATAQRVGMEWVGETEKYYDLRLQVYRLRKGELDVPQAGARAARLSQRATYTVLLDVPPVRWLSNSTTCAATVAKTSPAAR